MGNLNKEWHLFHKFPHGKGEEEKEGQAQEELRLWEEKRNLGENLKV